MRLRILILVTAASAALVFLGSMNAPRLRAQGGAAAPGVNGVGYPTCSYCPKPQYTDAALKAKFQGNVVLQAVIQTDGHATDIKVVKSPGLGLDANATEAVKTWRFSPALNASAKPVATATRIEVLFRLPDQKAASK